MTPTQRKALWEAVKPPLWAFGFLLAAALYATAMMYLSHRYGWQAGGALFVATYLIGVGWMIRRDYLEALKRIERDR